MVTVKEESEEAGLKLNTQKPKIMASGPNTLWQIDEGKVKTVTDFISHSSEGYKVQGQGASRFDV